MRESSALSRRQLFRRLRNRQRVTALRLFSRWLQAPSSRGQKYIVQEINMQPLSKRPFCQKALVLHRRHGLPVRPHQECAIHSRPHAMQPLARCINHARPVESRSAPYKGEPVELPMTWRACKRADPHIVHGRSCVKRRDKTLRRHSVVIHLVMSIHSYLRPESASCASTSVTQRCSLRRCSSHLGHAAVQLRHLGLCTHSGPIRRS